MSAPTIAPAHPAAASLAWPPPGPDEALAAAGAGPEDRVLVLGTGGAEVLCAALRRGCRAATGVVAPQRHPEPADVVVAPRVATREEALAVADCARRALRGAACRGRLAIGLAGARIGSLARMIGRVTAAHGFTRARLRARAEGGVLLVCDLAALPGPARGR